MDKRTIEIVKEFITKVAAQNSNLMAAYIFDSYVHGNQTEDSDVDVALVFDHIEDGDKFELQVQLMLSASNFDTRIEPHLLSKEDFYPGNPFAVEIQRTGIEIEPQAFYPK